MTYFYRAYNATGGEVSGSVVAETSEEAIRDLRQLELYPIEITGVAPPTRSELLPSYIKYIAHQNFPKDFDPHLPHHLEYLTKRNIDERFKYPMSHKYNRVERFAKNIERFELMSIAPFYPFFLAASLWFIAIPAWLILWDYIISVAGEKVGFAITGPLYWVSLVVATLLIAIALFICWRLRERALESRKNALFDLREKLGYPLSETQWEELCSIYRSIENGKVEFQEISTHLARWKAKESASFYDPEIVHKLLLLRPVPTCGIGSDFDTAYHRVKTGSYCYKENALREEQKTTRGPSGLYYFSESVIMRLEDYKGFRILDRSDDN